MSLGWGVNDFLHAQGGGGGLLFAWMIEWVVILFLVTKQIVLTPQSVYYTKWPNTHR